MLCHNIGVLCPKQDTSRGKPGCFWSACLVLKTLKKSDCQPPSPCRHTARQHIKGLWEDTCVALLNPSLSPLSVPGMSSHTPRGKKGAVDSDIPKGQNLQGLKSKSDRDCPSAQCTLPRGPGVASAPQRPAPSLNRTFHLVDLSLSSLAVNQSRSPIPTISLHLCCHHWQGAGSKSICRAIFSERKCNPFLRPS